MIERLLLVAIVSAGLACAGPNGQASGDAEVRGAVGAGEPGGALACPTPGERPELVRVTDLAPAVREDVRYATGDNFTGAPLPGYETPAALLRPAAAEALARVQAALAGRGYGLLVWDAYRPVRATLAMVDWAERTGNEWVLDDGYVARRSNHNRGNTVDLTVVARDTGEPLDMGTAYDHFGPESHTAN
ncbi:MAG: M15 family metallopeptidase, partial [Gemmatimonadota bacterium]